MWIFNNYTASAHCKQVCTSSRLERPDRGFFLTSKMRLTGYHIKSRLSNLGLFLTSDSCNGWIYLSNHCQIVKVGGVPSPTEPVTSGVPQGFVLCLLLFLVYINDITFDINIQCQFYVDDCVPFSEANSSTGQTKLVAHLNSISEWCKD